MTITPFCGNKNKMVLTIPTVNQGREVNIHAPRPQRVEFSTKAKAVWRPWTKPITSTAAHGK
jgi:hypothetical protein